MTTTTGNPTGLATELFDLIIHRTHHHSTLLIQSDNEPREHDIFVSGHTIGAKHGQIEAELIVAELAYAFAAAGTVTVHTTLPHTPDDHETGLPIAEVRGWAVTPDGYTQWDRTTLERAITHCGHCDEIHELMPGLVLIGVDDDTLVDNWADTIPVLDGPSDDDPDEEEMLDETDRLTTIIDDHFDTLEYGQGDDPAAVYDSYCEVPETILNDALAHPNERAVLMVTMKGRHPRLHVANHVDDNGDLNFTGGTPEWNLARAELLYCSIRGGAVLVTNRPAGETAEARGWTFDPDWSAQCTVDDMVDTFGPPPDGVKYIGPE